MTHTLDTQSEVETLLQAIGANANPLDSLQLLSEALITIKPCTSQQKIITRKILDITPDAARISPVKTLEYVSKAFLWVGAEYITPFARLVLILEKAAIHENHEEAFLALENVLMLCYCKVKTKSCERDGKTTTGCLSWQNQFFTVIVDTLQHKHFINPFIAHNTLKLSQMITKMSPALVDVHMDMNRLTVG